MIAPLQKEAAHFITYHGHTFPVGDNKPLDVFNEADVQRAVKETGARRVFNFQQGEGSILDKRVKLVTHTGKDGTHQRGTMRIDVQDERGGRQVFERPIAQLPSLIGQLLAKGYAPGTNHPIRQAMVMKAFDPNEERDEQGKWTSGGGTGYADAISKDEHAIKLRSVINNRPIVYRGTKTGKSDRRGHVFVTNDRSLAELHAGKGGKVSVYRIKRGGHAYPDPEIEGGLDRDLSGKDSLRNGSAVVHTDDLEPVFNYERKALIKAQFGGETIPQADVLRHILDVNPPGQIKRGKMTPLEWAKKYMTPEPRGYVRMTVAPQVLHIPNPIRDVKRVVRYAEQPSEGAPAVVVDANETMKVRYRDSDKVQEHTLVDGRHRLLAALQRGDRTIEALVPVRLAKRLADESRRVWGHEQKAAGHWVTVAGGKHIFIGEGQGQPKEQAQNRYAAEPGTATELTHEQMTTIAQKLAGRMGIDPKNIEVATENEVDESGIKMGEFSPESGKITLYPSSFNMGKEELIGTLAHESAHANFYKVAQEYNQQQKLYQQGESLLGGKIDLFKDLRPFFGSAKDALQKQDGQTPYSNMFWEKFEADQTSYNYVLAVNETLAECARLKQTGKESEIHPLWKFVQGYVNRYASQLGA